MRPMLKFCVGPRGDVLTSTYSHADAIGPERKYDRYVRALFWAERKIIYFRYSGDYDHPECPEERQKAFDRADRALAVLQARRVIPKRVKVLYWETGHGVTEKEIKL